MRALPPRFSEWFSKNGWSPHPHQQEMLDAKDQQATLLIAPTGGGKTLAGFLPTLVENSDGYEGLHTLYVSPLKALAADIRRNLETPISEMDLPIRVEDRTGDTSATKKRRQRADPPNILLTTPESLALLTSYEDAPRMFAGLSRVIIDEIHALRESKRGDQLMLALTRLQEIAPGMRRVGLSATVEDAGAMGRYLGVTGTDPLIIEADPGPDPDISMLTTDEPPPWSGGGGKYAIPAVLDAVKQHKTTLIFHNTRAQAEIFFHNLWLKNDESLPIAIHHGSLARTQREKVEQAMLAGQLRAIVCTGTLDLGIDWGDVDLIIQIGAPKNVKRLVQRIGRANHRYNAPSKALIVPANRFEVVECVAALEAVRAKELDGEAPGPGPRDVLCQHILIRAAAGPFWADELYDEVCGFSAFANLERSDFDACLEFIATGGYALRAYDQWQRLIQLPDRQWRLRDPRATARIRMNIGTIQDSDMMKVKMRGQMKTLGEVEEYFAASLSPGDTFLIGGRIVAFDNIREMTVQVRPAAKKRPKIAVFSGTKFSTSTQLSARVLEMFRKRDWRGLPDHTASWLDLQTKVSKLPQRDRIMVETFPHDGRQHMVIYGFAGRNAMQTLGLLVTRRMEDAGLDPLSFVSTDYALLVSGLSQVPDPKTLLNPDDLRDGLETWLQGNAVMKRTFKTSAVIAGLIDRVSPGAKKSGRQATFSSDILYDTLMKYDPEHLMLKITREEAMRGLVDFGRIEEMLERTNGKVDHVDLDRVTPLAAPMFLEVGRIPVKGAAQEKLVAEEIDRLMATAGIG